MKALRVSIATLPLLLAGTLAGAATVWSPIACGCAAPWQAIAWTLGLAEVKQADDLTAERIAAGIERRFEGRRVRPSDLPGTGPHPDCADAPAHGPAIRCTWWIWEAPAGRRGFEATVHTDPGGIFARVQVAPVTWLDPAHDDA